MIYSNSSRGPVVPYSNTMLEFPVRGAKRLVLCFFLNFLLMKVITVIFSLSSSWVLLWKPYTAVIFDLRSKYIIFWVFLFVDLRFLVGFCPILTDLQLNNGFLSQNEGFFSQFRAGFWKIRRFNGWPHNHTDLYNSPRSSTMNDFSAE